MEISVKSLWMGATVIITVALITLGVYEFNNAKVLAGTVTSKVTLMSSQIESEDILRYDGITVKGSDIYSFCKRFLVGSDADITVTVDNGAQVSGYEGYAEAKAMYDDRGAGYVNPLDEYSAQVIINENEVITGVRFTKK